MVPCCIAYPVKCYGYIGMVTVPANPENGSCGYSHCVWGVLMPRLPHWTGSTMVSGDAGIVICCCIIEFFCWSCWIPASILVHCASTCLSWSTAVATLLVYSVSALMAWRHPRWRYACLSISCLHVRCSVLHASICALPIERLLKSLLRCWQHKPLPVRLGK